METKLGFATGPAERRKQFSTTATVTSRGVSYLWLIVFIRSHRLAVAMPVSTPSGSQRTSQHKQKSLLRDSMSIEIDEPSRLSAGLADRSHGPSKF